MKITLFYEKFNDSHFFDIHQVRLDYTIADLMYKIGVILGKEGVSSDDFFISFSATPKAKKIAVYENEALQFIADDIARKIIARIG